jgi:hypothetical protein
VAIAAAAPVILLLLNRVFSPQYLVMRTAVWAISGSLLLERRGDQLKLGVAVMIATAANAFVYPHTAFQLGLWRAASAVVFLVGLSATAWIVARALRAAGRPEPVDVGIGGGSFVSTA